MMKDDVLHNKKRRASNNSADSQTSGIAPLVYKETDGQSLDVRTKTKNDLLLTPFPICQDVIDAERSILNALELRKEKVSVTCASLEPRDLFKWFTDRHPEIFWIETEYIRYQRTYFKKITMFFDNVFQESARTNIELLYAQFLHSVTMTTGTTIEKLIAIYNWFCRNITYDINSRKSSYNAVGVIVNKSAVCSGISKAFLLACKQNGIPCGIVNGNTSVNPISDHCWNIVLIEGAAYHIDVTAGINLYSNSNCIGYPYFLVPEKVMRRVRYINCTTPYAESNKYRYTYYYGQHFSGKAELEAWIKNRHGIYTVSGSTAFWGNGEAFRNALVSTATQLNPGKTICSYSYPNNTVIISI